MKTPDDILHNFQKESIYPKKIEELIKKRFFDLLEDEQEIFLSFYRNAYGVLPYEKMINDYPNWLKDKQIPENLYSSLFKFTVRFLNNAQLFELLKYEFFTYIDTLNVRYARRKIDLKDLVRIYKDYVKELGTFDLSKLSWISQNFLYYKDVEIVLKQMQYSWGIQVQNSFNQVYKDIEFLRGRLKVEFRYKDVRPKDMTYIIALFGTQILIDPDYKPMIPHFELNDLKQTTEDGIFQEFMNNYILDEYLNLNHINGGSEINKQLIYNDLDLFLKQFWELNQTPNQVRMESILKGQGGWFYILFYVDNIQNRETTNLDMVLMVLTPTLILTGLLLQMPILILIGLLLCILIYWN